MQTSKPWHIEIEYILSYLLPNRWICIIETNCILMSKTLSGVVLYYVILDVPTIEYYVYFIYRLKMCSKAITWMLNEMVCKFYQWHWQYSAVHMRT